MKIKVFLFIFVSVFGVLHCQDKENLFINYNWRDQGFHHIENRLNEEIYINGTGNQLVSWLVQSQ